MRALLLASAALTLFGIVPVSATNFDLTVWSYNGIVNTANFSTMLAGASQILTRADSQPPDVPCPTIFGLKPPIANGSTELLPAVINSKVDFDRIRQDGRFSIYLVRRINWCGGAAVGGVFAGCTSKGGPVVLVSDLVNPIVAAHELGHGQGLGHNAQKRYLMYPLAKPQNTWVTSTECDAFEGKQLFPVIVDGNDDFPFQQADTGPQGVIVPLTEDGPIVLDDLLDAYWHEFPLDEIKRLNADQVQEVRSMLDEGQPSARWTNAPQILGLRGAADDFAILQDVIGRATTELAKGAPADGPTIPWGSIRANAIVALGWLAYQFPDQPAILATIRGMATAPQAEFPDTTLTTDDIQDISQSALLAFAQAGPQASAAYPAAIAQNQILNLQINEVFRGGGPIVASRPDERSRNSDPSTLPSLAVSADGLAKDRALQAIESINAFMDVVDDVGAQVAKNGLLGYLSKKN